MIRLAYLLLAGLSLVLRAEAVESDTYRLPPELMVHYKVTPVPALSLLGQPRPVYDWRLYGLSRTHDTTRFLFELTIYNFNQLVDSDADDHPFYHVGYVDISDRGEIEPNATLVVFGDPQLLFPRLPDHPARPGDTWSQPGDRGSRDYRVEAVTDRLLHLNEFLEDPGSTNRTATGTITFDRDIGLVVTNRLVVSGVGGVKATNDVQMVEYLYYEPTNKPMMSRWGPDYLDTVTGYLAAVAKARELRDPREVNTVLNQARYDLNRGYKTMWAPKLKVMIKQYMDAHAAVAQEILNPLVQQELLPGPGSTNQ